MATKIWGRPGPNGPYGRSGPASRTGIFSSLGTLQIPFLARIFLNPQTVRVDACSACAFIVLNLTQYFGFILLTG